MNSLGELIVRSPIGHYIDNKCTEKRIFDVFSSILWPTGDRTINSLGELIVRSSVGHYIEDKYTEKRIFDDIFVNIMADT